MNRFIIAVLLAGFAGNASAQGYDRRVDVARFYDEQRNFHPEREPWRGNKRQLSDALAQLGREAAQIRKDIRIARGADRAIRRRFAAATKKLDQLNARFQHGDDRRAIWRETQTLRGDLAAIRADLRALSGSVARPLTNKRIR